MLKDVNSPLGSAGTCVFFNAHSLLNETGLLRLGSLLERRHISVDGRLFLSIQQSLLDRIAKRNQPKCIRSF